MLTECKETDFQNIKKMTSHIDQGTSEDTTG